MDGDAHIREIMDERDRAHKREHILIDKALDKAAELREEAIRQARIVVDQRLEKLNELRSEVQEDRSSYMTKDSFEAFKTEAARQRRANLIAFGTLAIAVIAVAVQVLSR